ncbi:DUF5776 domain-containing protein [Levilactobacillus brevis]|uniref:DUF5776 domain-containing protein n=1 Tax=Levilactobacillus brevis TaxID=1580 RepID=UPI000847DA65|nr:DUF5776 domain-containing protein [Levilactobacillus brevis]ODP93032.1 hypothetical protein BGC39_00035 [Levilactobacillus brevis]ODP93260.1 hypothetical protein BGC39_02120 [Levilactobacillus brevis]
MKNKCLLMGMILSLATTAGVTIYENRDDCISVVALADSDNYAPLLSGDSGVGQAKDVLSELDNYPNPWSNSTHSYERTLTTEVFHLSLNHAFSSGGTISLSPDYSNNEGSKIPVVVKDIYIYNSSKQTKEQIYNNGNPTGSNGYSVSKAGSKYNIIVPSDDNIAGDTLVFTISPLNSKEETGNSYQHPSYGVHVFASSHDGKVDGSDYLSQNGGWGVLWGQFDNGSSTPVSLATHTANVIEGNSYDLDSQVKNKGKFASFNWVLRDADGNYLNVTDVSSLSEGTYYATFYGKESDGNWNWDTIQINVKAPNPTPVQQGTVTTHYVDKQGNKIATDDVQKGDVGSSYSTTQKNISGYNFSKVNGNSTGTYTNGNTDVTYIYSKNVTPTPTPVKKGQAVYAIKKIGLYSNKNFSKNDRKVWYNKLKRTERPMFVVTGYFYSKNGNLRYKVRDVNHGKKTDKLSGYITANKKYVLPIYYSTLPKTKKVTVINPKGINAYKSVNLSGKSVHYKKGKTLKVVKFKKYNLTTRYVLSNGYYITANKKLIISVK